MKGNGKHKRGLPHVFWKHKPAFLNSRATWIKRGWKPSDEAKPVAWTWLRGASFKLYHLAHCQPIKSKAAEKRRVKHGFTEAQVKDMWLPVQLDLAIPESKPLQQKYYPDDMPVAALFAAILLGADPVELKKKFCAQNNLLTEK